MANIFDEVLLETKEKEEENLFQKILRSLPTSKSTFQDISDKAREGQPRDKRSLLEAISSTAEEEKKYSDIKPGLGTIIPGGYVLPKMREAYLKGGAKLGQEQLKEKIVGKPEGRQMSGSDVLKFSMGVKPMEERVEKGQGWVSAGLEETGHDVFGMVADIATNPAHLAEMWALGKGYQKAFRSLPKKWQETLTKPLTKTAKMKSIEQMAFEELGLKPGASQKQIDLAFKRRSKLFHPDKFPLESKVAATERFKDLNEAYKFLTGKGTSFTSYKGPFYSFHRCFNQHLLIVLSARELVLGEFGGVVFFYSCFQFGTSFTPIYILVKPITTSSISK